MYNLINKNLKYSSPKKSLVLGSIMALEQQNLKVNGKKLSYMQIYRRVIKNGFWQNRDYMIKKVNLIRSKNPILKNIDKKTKK